ncbi:MAG: UDP-glucose/GDP-mannose dehydrogenase family protein [Bradyrhizobium sp.]|uniref:UDP-glucose dehydrogenase family protein n=1 Tax=Bradyrhizobium sp. TaxID=376 RepID=UPI001E03A098|nr:UDP-glucose/GDP-mannose dehydrogenase family protein [Bradyrhizobium sp.]MBV9561421.1 UDP-glucose/GDP-mannose dehydrogenase family protein [Bradyrhizobium sp.]
MRIAIVGTGYVGLVSAACFAKAGHHVTCVDIDSVKISLLSEGRIPIYEPGLAEVVAERGVRKRLAFTSDAAVAALTCEIIFLAVGTPARRSDGHADLSQVFAAVETLAPSLQSGAVLVTKSTVPVGTGDEIEHLVRNLRPELDFEVASNPEFLRAGRAIEDFVRPDRVVIGAQQQRAADLLVRLYRSVGIERIRILLTDRRSAELIKYAANGFLATKIAFINEVANLCEKVDARIGDVASGIGLDGRIGMHYLQPGPGFGGSCFPKDARALVKMGEDHEAPMRIIETVLASNDARKRAMARKVAGLQGGSLRGKTFALLGLTFKAGTDDMRDAVSIPLAQTLIDAGSLVKAYDPVATDRARGILPARVRYCTSALDAAHGADAIVIATEWDEFRGLDFQQLKARMRTPTIVDLRNLLSETEVRANGFRYVGIGSADRPPSDRPAVAPQPRSWKRRSGLRSQVEEETITAAE